MTSRRQPDRILLIQFVNRRFKFHRMEWRARTDQRFLPKPAVQIHFARMRFVVAGPVNPAKLLEPAVTHARVHWAQLPHFVPNSFSVRLTPLVPESARQ